MMIRRRNRGLCAVRINSLFGGKNKNNNARPKNDKMHRAKANKRREIARLLSLAHVRRDRQLTRLKQEAEETIINANTTDRESRIDLNRTEKETMDIVGHKRVNL